jgi:hypothetical protein
MEVNMSFFDYGFDAEDEIRYRYIRNLGNLGRILRDNKIHTTKDGKEILIKDMDDKHLYNAYMSTGREDFLVEMILRLFEERINK